MLKVKNLYVEINNKKIIEDMSFELLENQILMVIGPNGAGKTTLIKAIMQNIHYKGSVMLENKDIRGISAHELARQIGVLMQKHEPQFPYSVYSIVSMGRYVHTKGLMKNITDIDKEKIEEAMQMTGVGHLKNQSITTLSGGELQRVFLAQLFAQDPGILILDEPTNHLDLQYQLAIFDIVKKWAQKPSRAVIAVVHDLNLVHCYGSHALLLNEGKTFAKGKVKDVMTRDNLEKVYKVDIIAWMKQQQKYWEE